MRVMLTGGLELACDDVGSGVPMLFIHSWPHDRTLWAPQLSGLPTYARCLAPDLRGFGNSTVAGPYSIDQYADDCAALLAVLDVDRAVVCGLSMGGYIALAMLRRHPHLLRGLVLASTRAGADTADVRARRMRMIDFVEVNGVAALASQQVRMMLSPATLATRPDVRDGLNTLMAGAPLEGVVGGLRAMANRADASDLLAAIEVPTLVIGGGGDTITPPAEMRAMADLIPNARFEVIEGTGHLCAWERPAAFNHLVGEFLAGLMYD